MHKQNALKEDFDCILNTPRFRSGVSYLNGASQCNHGHYGAREFCLLE